MKEINLDTKDTKEKYFLMKVKEHKTEIAIATVTAFAVVVGIVIHKNSSVFNISEKYIAKSIKGIKGISPMLTVATDNYGIDNNLANKDINVSGYPRKLREGHKRSSDRLELALQHQCILADDETWVNPYSYQKMGA